MDGQDQHRRGSDNTPSHSRQPQSGAEASGSNQALVTARQDQPAPPSPGATATPAQVTSCPTAGYFREKDTEAKRKECYLSISADVRVKPVDACELAPQSLSDFRGRNSTTLRLTRMSEEDAEKARAGQPDVSLATLLQGLVGKKDGFGDCALRVRGELRSVMGRIRGKTPYVEQEWIVLVAASQQERDSWLGTLEMIVAPWSALENAMRAAMSSTPCGPSASSSAAGSSLLTPSLQGTGTACVQYSASSSSSPAAATKQSSLTASIARGSEALVTFANNGNSVVSFGGTIAKEIAEIAGTAEKLTTPLASFALVGPAFFGLSVIARSTQMLASAHADKPKLKEAHRTLQSIQRDLEGVLRAIFTSDFQDNNLLEKVFRCVQDSWDGIVLIERHMFKSFVGRALNANEVAPMVDSVEQLDGRMFAVGILKHVADLKGDMSELKLLRLELQTVAEGVEKNKEAIQQFESRMSTEKREDSFKPSFSTIPKLARATIEKGIPGLEKLKEQVLSSHSVAAVAAKGDGGVGKTTACIYIARNPEVRARFDEGIYFVTLGETASESSVVAHISRIVANSGGANLSKEIEAKPEDVANAVIKASGWFERRRVLLIVDNVWTRSSSSAGGLEWALTLADIVDEGPRCCFLFSTRMPHLASFAIKKVDFERFDMTSDDGREGAVSMFELYADNERNKGSSSDLPFGELNQEYQKALKYILQLCDGWQLLLAMAGAYAEACHYHWDGICTNLEREFLCSVGGRGAVRHQGFCAIMQASLTFVDKASCSIPKHRLLQDFDAAALQSRFGETWFTNIYASLSIYESPRSVLIPVLAVQLGVDESEAWALARLFKNMSLASLWEDEANEIGSTLRLSLHDMKFAYATSLCGDGEHRPKQCDLHDALLDRVAEKIGERDSDRTEVNWSLLFEGERCVWREYFQSHLARHMLLSVGSSSLEPTDGSTDDMESTAQPRAKLTVSFLTDYRWMRGCIKIRGRGGLLVDNGLFVKSADGWPANVQDARDAFFRALPSGALRAVEILREILAATIPLEEFQGDVWCEKHGRLRDRGLASQLYGRLKAVEEGEMVSAEERGSFQGAVRTMMESIVLHARRPWLRTTSNCYDAVRAVEKHWKESFRVSDKCIRHVAFLNLGVGRRVVVSGDGDGKLRVNDLEDAGWSAVELGAHKDSVQGMAVSDGGGAGGCPLVASCSAFGEVCIWDPSPLVRNFGEAKSSGARISAVDRDLRVATLLEEGAGRCDDVSISADGSRVLAADSKRDFKKGESDWRVHLWTRQPNLSYDHRLLFEYSTKHFDGCLVAISKDGETALYCEKGSGVLRAWRTSDGKLLYTSNVPRAPVVDSESQFHGNDAVTSILLSDDAATLYAGTFRGKIQVFDTQLGKVVDCMHAENFVTSPACVSSMALVECKGHGDGAQPITHLFSAHKGGAIARWSVEKARTLLAVYGVPTVPGARRAKGGLKCIAVRNGAAAEPGTLGGGGDDRGVCGAARIEIVTGYESGNLARWTLEECVANPKERGREIVVAEEVEIDSDEVRCASCSRDGVFVACGMRSGRISLRRTDGRGVIWTSASRCHGEVDCIDISNDGTLVAACGQGDRNILLLDGGDGEEIYRLSEHKCGVRCVIFTQDGKYLGASGGANIFLWDMDICNFPMEIWAYDGRVNSGIYTFATAAASETGSGDGLDILVSVNESMECCVWSLVDLKLLFRGSLESTDRSKIAETGFVDRLTKSWGWQLWDWREQRVLENWNLHSAGCSTTGGFAKITQSSPILEVAVLPAMSTSLVGSLCSCCRCHIQLDSDFPRHPPFACNSAALGASSYARVDNESAIDSVCNARSVGHVLLGCQLDDRKLAIFELMEFSEPER